MSRRGAVFVLCLVVVSVTTAGTAAATVRGSPDISASLQDDTVVAGEETTLDVVLVNSGDLDLGSARNPALNSEVTTARGLTVDVRDGNVPISVSTGARSLGSLSTGTPTTASFDISVDEDAEPGTYRVPVELEYDYYNLISERAGARSTGSSSPTRYVTVTVSDDASFDVTNVAADTQVGSSGPVAVTVENTGQTTANNSEVTLSSQNGELTFGDRSDSTRSVDSWEPGEDRTFRYDISATEDAQAESYPFQLSVAFDNSDGVRKASTGTAVSITPDPEQTFTISDIVSSLQVGSDGVLEASVINNGPRDADNVVLTWESDQRNLSPQETQVSVGDLAAGSSKRVSFNVDVTDAGQPGRNQFDFTASFRGSGGERERSDTLEIRAGIAPDSPEFELEAANTSIGAGQSDTIQITVTNTRDVALTDISAQLFADSPISADDDEAFIPALDPSESETLTFSLSSDGSALEKSYPLSVDFEYTEPDGDTVLSDTYNVAIDVTDSSGDGGVPVGLIGLLTLGGFVGVLVWYRRR